MHGLRGNAHNFDIPARRFWDQFHVISVDVRARGDSAWSPEGRYDRASYVADLEGLMDALGLERFTLAGASMGGTIAMTYAGLHPERLERLIIIDIGPDQESGSTVRISAEAAETPPSFADLTSVLPHIRGYSPSFAALGDEAQRAAALYHVRQEQDGRWVWKMDPKILEQRAGGPSSRAKLWEVLARVLCPTLVVWGIDSDVLSEGQARRMVETLPDGELLAVPGARHTPTLNEPEAVEALDRFLAVPVAL